MALVDESETPLGTPRRKLLALAGAVAFVLLATTPWTTTSYLTGLVYRGLVFVMLGVSWSLLAGYAGQVSLGHAAFFGLGAFVSAWLTTPARAGLPGFLDVPVVASLVGAAVVAALLALVTGPVMFRLTGHYFAIGTLALATIIQLVMVDQRQFTGGQTGFYVEEGLGEPALFVLAFFATLGVVLVTYWIVESRFGLGMRAIHGDQAAASSLGVRPLTYKMHAFVVSSAMAGLAGGFYAQYELYISPESTLSVTWMIDVLVVVVLGGMGTIVGPIVGSGVFLVLNNSLAGLVGDSLATTVEGVLIIVVVIFAPRGLYGLFDGRVFPAGEDTSAAAGNGPEAAEGDPSSSDLARGGTADGDGAGGDAPGDEESG